MHRLNSFSLHRLFPFNCPAPIPIAAAVAADDDDDDDGFVVDEVVDDGVGGVCVGTDVWLVSHGHEQTLSFIINTSASPSSYTPQKAIIITSIHMHI